MCLIFTTPDYGFPAEDGECIQEDIGSSTGHCLIRRIGERGMPVTDRMKDVSNSPHGTWRCRKRGTGIIASLQDPDFKGCAVIWFLWVHPLNSADKIRSDFILRIGRKDCGKRPIGRRMALNKREKCEENRANCGNFGEKHGKDIQNGLSEEGKHRTSRAQTSELLP